MKKYKQQKNSVINGKENLINFQVEKAFVISSKQKILSQDEGDKRRSNGNKATSMNNFDSGILQNIVAWKPIVN